VRSHRDATNSYGSTAGCQLRERSSINSSNHANNFFCASSISAAGHDQQCRRELKIRRSGPPVSRCQLTISQSISNRQCLISLASF
jgi:hypothetical protein